MNGTWIIDVFHREQQYSTTQDGSLMGIVGSYEHHQQGHFTAEQVLDVLQTKRYSVWSICRIEDDTVGRGVGGKMGDYI